MRKRAALPTETARLAAKLDFSIEAATAEPIARLAPLLAGLLYELAPTSRSAARQWLGAILESKVFTVSSGFLFEPRSKDIWVRFKVWWAGRTSRFGLLC